MLLDLSLGVGYDEIVYIQGYKLRFYTVDLSIDFNTISEQLLKLIVGSRY